MNEYEQKIAILNRISFVLEGIRKMTDEQKNEVLNLLLEDCKENGNDAFREEIIKILVQARIPENPSGELRKKMNGEM